MVHVQDMNVQDLKHGILVVQFVNQENVEPLEEILVAILLLEEILVATPLEEAIVVVQLVPHQLIVLV
jgi:hypothetical protein